MTTAAATRVAGEHLAAVLDVRAGDVDLDHRDCPGLAQPRASLAYSSTRAAGDRHHRARAALDQPGQVAFEEDVDARDPAARSS